MHHYYKVVAKKPNIGSIINTIEAVDWLRINRMSKLNRLFSLLYELSFETDLPLQNILSLIFSNFNPISKFEINENILKKIEIIKSEVKTSNFIVHVEFRFFNDFVLDKVKNELYNENNLELPDRYKSHFFFESLSDCYLYCLELGLNQKKDIKIIEVKFVEAFICEKMDNRLVSDFKDYYSSKHFYNQAKKFLTNKSSENPLFEIIFQGKYKVTNMLPLINI